MVRDLRSSSTRAFRARLGETLICLTTITCDRSRASGAIRPTLKTVHLQLSPLPLAIRPLAMARPCHARPTHQPSVSPATQRPTNPNSASGGHEKPLPGTAIALPRKVENSKKVQIPPSSCRTALLPLWIGRYVLLLCSCTSVVVLLPPLPLLLVVVTTAFVSKNKKSDFCGHGLVSQCQCCVCSSSCRIAAAVDTSAAVP